MNLKSLKSLSLRDIVVKLQAKNRNLDCNLAWLYACEIGFSLDRGKENYAAYYLGKALVSTGTSLGVSND